MTAHNSILKTNPFEPKLRWMILFSFLLHLVLMTILIGKPPQKQKSLFLTGLLGQPGKYSVFALIRRQRKPESKKTYPVERPV